MLDEYGMPLVPCSADELPLPIPPSMDSNAVIRPRPCEVYGDGSYKSIMELRRHLIMAQDKVDVVSDFFSLVVMCFVGIFAALWACVLKFQM